MNSISGWIGRFFIRRTPYAVATPLGWSDGVYAKIARSEAFDESLSVRSVRRHQELLTFSKSISAACPDSVTTQQDVFVRSLSHANAAINLSTLLNWSRRPPRISVTTRMIAPPPTRPHKMFSSFGPQRPIGPSYWIEGTMWQKSHLRDFGSWAPIQVCSLCRAARFCTWRGALHSGFPAPGIRIDEGSNIRLAFSKELQKRMDELVDGFLDLGPQDLRLRKKYPQTLLSMSITGWNCSGKNLCRDFVEWAIN